MPGVASMYYATHTRPDTAGSSKGGGQRNRTSSRDKKFPYDRDETMYGSPAKYDRGSNKGHPDFTGQLVPKNTEGTPWDDGGALDPDRELDEITGYPVMVGKSGNGQGGGRTAPGTSGRWGGTNVDTETDYDALEKAGRGMPTSPMHQRQFYAGRQGRGGGYARQREGQDPWIALEAFVSLRDVQDEPMDGGAEDVDAVELQTLVADFKQTFERTLELIDSMDPTELFAVIVDLDPEFAAASFTSKIGAKGTADIYRSWGDVTSELVGDEAALR